jgi:hypothetical protein
MIKMKNLKNFSWMLFWVGLIAALGTGIAETYSTFSMPWLPWVLVIIGSAIGLFNISNSEAEKTMIATGILGMSAGVFSVLPFAGGIIQAVLSKVAALALPIGIVVAIKILSRTAKK